mmetsp:Transcript_1795/g.4044  ORF Transcript_1795/g.4044 Transcript_1795/m.4044 type:complete len:95 (+) Transcript_1795:1640-1924(+)
MRIQDNGWKQYELGAVKKLQEYLLGNTLSYRYWNPTRAFRTVFPSFKSANCPTDNDMRNQSTQRLHKYLCIKERFPSVWKDNMSVNFSRSDLDD